MTLAGCEHQESRLISYNGNYLNDEGAYYSVSENTTSNLCLGEENTVDDIEETKESIYVSILGEVSSPGVYVMPEGSRTYELINEAGGATENADTARLNLVSLLEDGMQITIPSYEADKESPTEGPTLVLTDNTESEGSKRALVNINTASISELTTLTGIGTTRAEAIINYRDSVGKFEKCEDLMNVTGIKQGIYDKLKDEICTR
jgi:competence protein ComEA